jgi:hypothetical protein
VSFTNASTCFPLMVLNESEFFEVYWIGKLIIARKFFNTITMRCVDRSFLVQTYGETT